MDHLTQLVIARALSILAADEAHPGSEEPTNLETARKLLAGINFPVIEMPGGVLPWRGPMLAYTGHAPKGRQARTMAHEMFATSQAAISEIPFCGERQRLLGRLTDAIEESILMRERQITALINGDLDFARFESVLNLAFEKEQQATGEYLHHVETHGC